MSIQAEFLSKVTSSEELRNHNCSEFIELRERQKGKGTAYANQCQVCGEAKGGEVPKKAIPHIPPPFDTELIDAYLKALKRLQANERGGERGLETESMSQPSTNFYEVFDQRLDELLLELDAEYPGARIAEAFQRYLGKEREEVRRGYSSQWKTEEQLSDWFETNFSEWFFIQKEVEGSGFVNRESKTVRIDFVLKPKPLLIEKGFTDKYIGVEVKFLNMAPNSGFSKQSSTGIFQALSYWYSGALWEVGESEPQPLATVLLFSNLSFLDEREDLFNSLDRYYRTAWLNCLSIANHANVGELQIRTDHFGKWGWRMEFSGASYFLKRPNGAFHKGNPNVINKQRIGNIRSKK